MISFVWSSKFPFFAGAGGSENYTAGHVRELIRRGIPTRILTLGHGERDGREYFPDIPFLALSSKHELSELDDTLVFVTYPLDVHTKQPAYAILHCPPPTFAHGDELYDRQAFKGKRLITTSKFAAGMWRRYLKGVGRMPTVYPFAEEDFSKVERPKRTDKPSKILFAGRLTPDKGVYTLLAALHMENLSRHKFELTVTTAGAHSEDGAIILPLLEAHPQIKVIQSRREPSAMAQLMAEHDVVVMPSTKIFWQETFGIVSIEAQHAGCRVVASNSGGLPETNTGGVVLTTPDNPQSLALGMAKAITLGPPSVTERQFAATKFTLTSSVNSLLKAIRYAEMKPAPATQLRGEAGVFPRLRPQLALTLDHSTERLYPPSRLIDR